MWRELTKRNLDILWSDLELNSFFIASIIDKHFHIACSSIAGTPPDGRDLNRCHENQAVPPSDGARGGTQYFPSPRSLDDAIASIPISHPRVEG